MRQFFIITLVAVTLLAGVAAPASAQQVPAPDVPGSGGDAQPTNTPESAEQIDQFTTLVSSSYNAQSGTATLVLRSRIQQTAVVSDAGAFNQGGKVPTRVVRMRPRSTSRVEIPVTQVNGRVGIGISTQETYLYAEIIQPGGDALKPMRAFGAIQAWLAGAIVALSWMVLSAWTTLRSKGGHPEVA